jgi:hypothetical protein
MLSETGRGRRRLFKPGDKFHRDRKEGKTHPSVEDLPAKYRYLVNWYEHSYANGNGSRVEDEDPLPPPGKMADLFKFVGMISKSDLEKMEAAIEEACEQEPLPPGVNLPDIIKFLGKISSSDRKKMEAAIEEDFERIAPNEW